MSEYNQEKADERHREKRERLLVLRNEMSDVLNAYYEKFPESLAEERELEYHIEERLRRVERDIDGFIRDFRNLPNE